MLTLVSSLLVFLTTTVHVSAGACAGKKEYKAYMMKPKPCKGSQTYVLKFQGAWSASRQPLNYPSTPLPIPALGNPTAIFSPAVVVSHSSAVQLFEVGQVVTVAGLEEVAETGATTVINETLTSLKGKGKPVGDIAISTAPSDSNGGMQMLNITVTPKQPLVSMVTMLFPSPDWITAIRNINMCDPQGFWKSGFMTENLQVYDAGTDSGVTFTSPDVDTNPQMPVSVLACGANFCDGNGAIPSVGKVSLVGVKKVCTRQRKKSSKDKKSGKNKQDNKKDKKGKGGKGGKGQKKNKKSKDSKDNKKGRKMNKKNKGKKNRKSSSSSDGNQGKGGSPNRDDDGYH